MFCSNPNPSVGFFQFPEAYLTNNVFNPVGVNLRCFFIYAYRHEPFHKETVSLIDFLGDFSAQISQMQKPKQGLSENIYAGNSSRKNSGRRKPNAMNRNDNF